MNDDSHDFKNVFFSALFLSLAHTRTSLKIKTKRFYDPGKEANDRAAGTNNTKYNQKMTKKNNVNTHSHTPEPMRLSEKKRQSEMVKDT